MAVSCLSATCHAHSNAAPALWLGHWMQHSPAAVQGVTEDHLLTDACVSFTIINQCIEQNLLLQTGISSLFSFSYITSSEGVLTLSHWHTSHMRVRIHDNYLHLHFWPRTTKIFSDTITHPIDLKHKCDLAQNSQIHGFKQYWIS